MSYEGRFHKGSFREEGREEKRWVSSLQRGEGWTGSGERDVIDSVVDGKEPQRGRGERNRRAEDSVLGRATR